MSSNVTLEIKGKKKSVLVFALLEIRVGRLIFFTAQWWLFVLVTPWAALQFFLARGFWQQAYLAPARSPNHSRGPWQRGANTLTLELQRVLRNRTGVAPCPWQSLFTGRRTNEREVSDLTESNSSHFNPPYTACTYVKLPDGVFCSQIAREWIYELITKMKTIGMQLNVVHLQMHLNFNSLTEIYQQSAEVENLIWQMTEHWTF